MNPLSAKPKVAAPAEHPMLAHAKIWQHVNAMAPDDVAQHTAAADYTTPRIGALAANPNVTRKDVIKAAADWAGVGKIPPSKAVEFISALPNEPDKLQPFLRNLYLTNMTALIHMKAAAMPGQQAAPTQGAPQ
jgi:hypothetical protein